MGNEVIDKSDDSINNMMKVLNSYDIPEKQLKWHKLLTSLPPGCF